jgi:hypothetical protein
VAGVTFTLRVEVGFGGASTSNYFHLDDSARGILGTNTLGPDDGVWTDITNYVHRLSTQRGTNRTESPLLRYEAGTAIIALDNSDRRFDPTNLGGPYVAGGATQVTPMRAVRILATYASVTYEVFRGFADEWRLSYRGPNYSLCELTCTDGTKVLANYTRTAVAATGAGDDTGARIDRILDGISWSATDRILDTGDTTVQATTLDGNVWDEMLLNVDTEAGELYFDEAGRVFFRSRGALLSDLRSTSAVVKFGDSPGATETTINLATNPSVETDTTGWGAGGTVPPTIARSNTRAKFGTWSLLVTWGTGGILPLAGYTATGLTIGRTYTATIYVWVPAGNPDVVLALGGVGFGTASTGLNDQWVRLTYTDVATTTSWGLQIWPLTSPTAGQTCFLDAIQVEEGGTSTSYCDGDQASSEWDGTAHASVSRRLPELRYHDLQVAYDDSTIANLVTITCVGGAAQSVSDTTSQAANLTHTFSRNDLIMQTDSAALDYANWVLYQAKDSELRFTHIVLKAHADEPNLLPQALGRRIGDRVRVVLRPPGGGSQISREVFIRGIQHEVEPLQWRTTFTFQSATKYAFLTLDHTTLGVLDSNVLAF